MDKQSNIYTKKNIIKNNIAVSGILQAVLVLSILVSLLTAFWRYQNTVFNQKTARSVFRASNDGQPADLAKSAKPLNYYADLVQQRDIFRLDAGAETIKPDTVTVSPAAVNFLAQYTVQGIVFDKDPRAIIKDNQTSKTYFVKRGQTINGATVTDIKRNAVVLNANGENFELTKK